MYIHIYIHIMSFCVLGIVAEWWKEDVEAVVRQATQSGLAPNVSEAHTINGLPGPVPGCFSQGTDMGVLLKKSSTLC